MMIIHRVLVKNTIIPLVFSIAFLTLFGSILSVEATFPGTNGKIVFVTSADIFTINSDGTGVTNLTDRPVRDLYPRFSSDGTKICFSSFFNSPKAEIYTMNVDGTDKTRVTNFELHDVECSWSPDGTKIVFQRNMGDGANDGIYVINVDGTGEMNLSNSPNTNDHDPDLSPDGSKIVFMRHDGSKGEIFVMNSDGTNKQNISNQPGTDDKPEWSPDGTEILFRKEGRIWIMDADGTNKHEFGGNPFQGLSATWSPDGKKIAYADFQGLYVVNIDGTGIVEITDMPGANNPHWQGVAATSDIDGDGIPTDPEPIPRCGPNERLVRDRCVAMDVTPPKILQPKDIEVDTDNPNGVRISFDVLVIDDTDEIVQPTCTPRSGSFFSVGDKRVTCTARDSAGNYATQISFTVTVNPPGISIPSWVKNVAEFWCADKIEDGAFVEGIQYLIDNGVIAVPSTSVSYSGSQEIPPWVKNNACWWSAGLITDEDFAAGIEYLVKEGIIIV